MQSSVHFGGGFAELQVVNESMYRTEHNVETLPGEEGGYHPGEEADQDGACLSADVARLQWFADGVISLEGNG